MQKEACIYIGFIAKKIGYKGNISIKIDGVKINEYLDLNNIYIEIDGQLIFYKIESSSIHQKMFIKMKLKDVDDENKEKDLIKKSVYVENKKVSIIKKNEFFNFDIIDFSVRDKNENFIGTVKEINTSTVQNILILLSRNKQEIMIPLVTSFIINIDKKNKIINVDLPDGLIDLN